MKSTAALYSVILLLSLSIRSYAQPFGLGVAETGLEADAPAEAPSLGRAVAMQERRVFIGASGGSLTPGVVHIYEPDIEGNWSETARLSASDAVIGDGFGAALAVDGDRLVVGADVREAAYIFEREEGIWVERARLTPLDARAGDQAARTVAIKGDVALVSAPFHQSQEGAVYVFARDATTGQWAEEAKISAPVKDLGRFGAALDLREDEALISAPYVEGATGAVYVFERDASGTWTQQQRITASTRNTFEYFGWAVTTDNDRALISAVGVNNSAGTVYLFERDGDGTWEEVSRLDRNEVADPFYGGSVVLHGAEAWVGSLRNDGIYVFEEDPGSGKWNQRQQIENSAGSNSRFSRAMAFMGNTGVTGAPVANSSIGVGIILERADRESPWVQAQQFSGEDNSLEAITGTQVSCSGGGVAAIFPCSGIDLLGFLPLGDLGAGPGIGANDIWGWTDPETSREYALLGLEDGVSFIDVTDPLNPVHIGNLPRTPGSQVSTWRDLKVYENHVFVVADGAGPQGMQVFDLTELRTATNLPVVFEAGQVYREVDSAHNIAINEESGFAYIVGARGVERACGGGLHMVDIREPFNPRFAGCFADSSTGRSGTGYTHDAQCVIYNGPDTEHQGKEICIGSNETAISIADVTDKNAPVALATGTYPDAEYVHQGWLTEDHRYFYQDDELDELVGLYTQTRTLIWDLADLDDPVLLAQHLGVASAIDHNQYVRGDYLYQSNYTSGLRVLDISEPGAPVEIAFFDTFPAADNPTVFDGTWSNYPFFASGNIIVSGRGEGLFILRSTAFKVASEDVAAPPSSFILAPAFPNPFTERTALQLTLPATQQVTIAVYDVLGRQVALLHEGPLPAGAHTLTFEAEDLPGGTYFVRANGVSSSTQVVTRI